jgi:HD-GYP domain-containing protein (c-di-GMP phosphodiesterase class II)
LSVISGALTANIAMLNLQEILQRQAEQLSPSQQQLLKLHPVLAEAMLTELDVDDALWLQSIRSHHERVDGQGYPNGTSAEQIPLGSRLISLADIYDAMIKPRAHREPNQRAALKELFLRRGQAIDENLAPIAVKEIGIYPPGAFVKLRNGEIAVVIKRTVNSLHPIVRSLFGPRGAPLERPYRRNTEESMFAIQDVVPRDRSIVLNLGRIWDYE